MNFSAPRAALRCAPALAAALTLVAAGPASALNWRIAPDESEIRFSYTEDGDPAEGRFTEFSGAAEFDLDSPDGARLDLEIEIDSITLSDNFRSNFVQTEIWFDEERFPKATFTLKRLVAIDPAAQPAAEGARQEIQYRAEGELTIKGTTLPAATPLTLVVEDGLARAQGVLRFNRFDFNVGDRVGALFVDIGDDVAVEFDLVAKKL